VTLLRTFLMGRVRLFRASNACPASSHANA